MRLLVGMWEVELERLLREARNQVTIISPFVTRVAPRLLRPVVEDRKVRCRLITRLNLNDLHSGVSDHKALIQLVKMGVEVKILKGLHAKVYVFDDIEAVVTSANFTGGGLTNRHEWGILVGREECAEVFEQADLLWDGLTKRLRPGDLHAIARKLEEFGRTHAAVVMTKGDLLPDEGETLDPPDASELEIALSPGVSGAAILAEIDRIVAAEPRLGDNKEHAKLRHDLRATGGKSISVRSYLWLVGWSNTGRAYKESSKTYVKPLVRSMFGYVPGRFLTVEGKQYDLKKYRYGSKRFRALDDSVVANHRDRLGSGD